MIEREDFGSGTSSKSTKLVHGGVRYLEKAVFNLDYGQLKLVYEALQERKNMLENAPHLTSELPILMPCYKWWELPFYWSGLKTYDLIAGFKNIAWSKILTPSESMRRLPTLAATRDDGYSLKGSVSMPTPPHPSHPVWAPMQPLNQSYWRNGKLLSSHL
jgi:glycerol-3-phosphate dehydrogenase